MRSKNIGMASEKTVSKHLNVLEIVPEIGRANSKPLSDQGDNHFCLHFAVTVSKGDYLHQNLTLF